MLEVKEGYFSRLLQISHLAQEWLSYYDQKRPYEALNNKIPWIVANKISL